MASDRPYVIGIAGASGSGKTALAHALAARLGADQSLVLPLDAAEKLRRRAGACRYTTLMDPQLVALIEGQTIQRPIYNYATHTRMVDSIPIESFPYIIVDGLLAFVSDPVRQKLQTKVFVETPDAVCLERRIARDVDERGRTRESVVQQFAQTVRPMFERYVAPTRQYADIIVRGDRPLELAVDTALAHVQSAGLRLH